MPLPAKAGSVVSSLQFFCLLLSVASLRTMASLPPHRLMLVQAVVSAGQGTSEGLPTWLLAETGGYILDKASAQRPGTRQDSEWTDTHCISGPFRTQRAGFPLWCRSFQCVKSFEITKRKYIPFPQKNPTLISTHRAMYNISKILESLWALKAGQVVSSTRLYTNFLENKKEKGRKKDRLERHSVPWGYFWKYSFYLQVFILQNSLILEQCTQGTIGNQNCLPHTSRVEVNPDGTWMCHGNTGPDFHTRNSL